MDISTASFNGGEFIFVRLVVLLLEAVLLQLNTMQCSSLTSGLNYLMPSPACTHSSGYLSTNFRRLIYGAVEIGRPNFADSHRSINCTFNIRKSTTYPVLTLVRVLLQIALQLGTLVEHKLSHN